MDRPRGPPRGNTVNRAAMNPAAENSKDTEIFFTHLMEGTGLALDPRGGVAAMKGGHFFPEEYPDDTAASSSSSSLAKAAI